MMQQCHAIVPFPERRIIPKFDCPIALSMISSSLTPIVVWHRLYDHGMVPAQQGLKTHLKPDRFGCGFKILLVGLVTCGFGHVSWVGCRST